MTAATRTTSGHVCEIASPIASSAMASPQRPVVRPQSQTPAPTTATIGRPKTASFASKRDSRREAYARTQPPASASQ